MELVEEPYPWTENEIKVIEEHQQYHRDMLQYLDYLKKNGPIERAPKTPQNKLPVINMKSEGLAGEKLQEYLKKRISTADLEFRQPTLPQVHNFTSLEMWINDSCKFNYALHL